MRSLSSLHRLRVMFVVGFAVTGLGWAGVALASTTSWKVQPSPVSNTFANGVAATSSTNAWAVGGYFPFGPSIIERWNGKVWKAQAGAKLTPPKGFVDFLVAVAATSSRNAWAVGDYQNSDGSKSKTLIEHWNGKAWKLTPSPSPGPFGYSNLNAVAATSSSNAWAVGGLYLPLIERWNGKAWKVQTSANVSHGSLSGVTAISSTDAWAVGHSGGRPLIEHWNGKAWKVKPSPKHRGSLNGVTAISRTDAWAVGHSGRRTLIEHWNGKAWKVEASPSPRCTYSLSLDGVSPASSTNVWAVGTCGEAYSAPISSPGPSFRTVIEHWNGNAWKIQKSPNPGGVGSGADSELYGVATVSSSDAWAVGYYCCDHAGYNRILILHWNGRR